MTFRRILGFLEGVPSTYFRHVANFTTKALQKYKEELRRLLIFPRYQ